MQNDKPESADKIVGSTDVLCCVSQWGGCCCGCMYHMEDFHHCVTVKDHVQCVCTEHKGWICMPPEQIGAHSGWSEHGICELWTPKQHNAKLTGGPSGPSG